MQSQDSVSAQSLTQVLTHAVTGFSSTTGISAVAGAGFISTTGTSALAGAGFFSSTAGSCAVTGAGTGKRTYRRSGMNSGFGQSQA